MLINIDNQQYEAKLGQTVLEVAQENGIDIPTLCHDPHLSVAGACRMCLVEFEDNGRMATSCTTKVSEGMNILTESQKVVESRKTILDLLLSDHPLDCMTCDANGDCQLQDLAYEYDLDKSSYGTKTDPRFEIMSDNPFIEVDPDKCILCGKCIRADHEIQCSYAINFSERGFSSKVATPFDLGLEAEQSTCVFCGQCVEMCPTGALTYKPTKGKGRDYEFDKVVTTCSYCGVGCQLELNVKDNEVVKVGSVYQEGRPNPSGEMCVKGRFGYQFINHPDRLKNPLIKKNGEFVEASWDEALDHVAENFSRIKDNHGGRQTGALSSARCTNEENYLTQKFMRAVMGTNTVEHCARL
jgi:formate dehydrogenase major subunit/formate dehydrogenase alpha subunit